MTYRSISALDAVSLIDHLTLSFIDIYVNAYRECFDEIERSRGECISKSRFAIWMCCENEFLHKMRLAPLDGPVVFVCHGLLSFGPWTPWRPLFDLFGQLFGLL